MIIVHSLDDSLPLFHVWAYYVQGILQNAIFDGLVKLSITGKAWRVIDLKEVRLTVSVQDNVETEDFEANASGIHLIIKIMRGLCSTWRRCFVKWTTCPIVVVQVWLNC